MKLDLYDCDDCGNYFGVRAGATPACCPICENDIVEMAAHDRLVS